MKIMREFREFAMRGNVIDLAIGVIIGAAFGGITKSMVDDILMPPIGKLVGNLDFSNLYFSLSEQVDAANAQLAAKVAATQPATAEGAAGAISGAISVFDTAVRLPLVEARKLGPVIAYGNFLTLLINFLIVAFCVFLIVKLINVAKRRFEREQAAAAAADPPPDVVLLTEIRDLLKKSPPPA